MDSGASHHLTSDLANMSLHSEYNGTEEVQLADGSGFPITHTGTSFVKSPSRNFILSNMLCVPSAANNLVSIHQFTKSNNVSVEFYPSCLIVKDRLTGAPLARGPCSNGVYYFC